MSTDTVISKLIAIIPWGLKKIYHYSAYAIIAYIFLGSLFSLLTNLDLINILNIVFGFGLILAGIMVLPAIMSTDSGSSTASSVFIGTVFSYPFVYLFSLFAGSWIPGIDSNYELAIAIAALPLINVLVFAGLVITLMIKEN